MKIIPKIIKENGILRIPRPIKEKQKQVEVEDDISLQLDLGLKQSPLNKLFEVRQKLDRLEDRVKLSQYWRNIYIWLIIFFPIMFFMIQMISLRSNYESIPDNIPLLWINFDLVGTFLPKWFLILIPVFVLLISFVIVVILRLAYRRMERYLALINVSVISISILCYIVTDRIINLFT